MGTLDKRDSTCIDGKPRVSYPKEEQKVARLRKISDEITMALARCLCGLDNRIWVNPVDSGGAAVGTEHTLDVGSCPLYVPIDVHRESRRFGNSEPEIESDRAGHTTQADENAPAVVYMHEFVEVVSDNGAFVRLDCCQCNETGS